MRNLLIISFLAIVGVSCKSTRIPIAAIPAPIPVSNEQFFAQMIDTSKVLKQGFVGVSLYDLEMKQSLFDYHADRYFTPASITKLYTFYACFKTLVDSIPAIRYVVRGDSLIFWGMADPSFLHKNFGGSKTLDFLKSFKKSKLFFSDGNFTNDPWGLGWAWEDYSEAFQTELSPMPIYGNVVRVNSEKDIQPKIFEKSFYTDKNDGLRIKRSLNDNQFFFPKKIIYRQNIPFKTSSSLLQQLLIDTLHKNVSLLKIPVSPDSKTIYSLPTDPIYRQMLQESDNFLAEHLLLACGAMMHDSINTSFTIKAISEKYLQDLPDKPKWIDGSGNSRYNLFTPRTTVKLLEKMYREVPTNRLYSLLAIGGQAGTIKNRYKADKPFVFAKSGSMGGVYNLSGYLITKQGKTIAFSIMNNNFIRPISEVNNAVEQYLTWLHKNY